MSFYDKANDNYAIASLAFGEKRYNAAAGRLYYALYQACVKKHMENGKHAADFMSSAAREDRDKSLQSKTDAPKWPHDVLTGYPSLYDLGLSAQQRGTIIQARKFRIIGDYGDTENVRREDLESTLEHAKDVFKQLDVPVAGR